MRLLYVWVTAVISCAIVTIFWLVGNSVVLALVNGGGLASSTGQAFSLTTLIEYIATWWGPIFDVVIIFWAIINSEGVEINSEILYR